MSPLSASAGTVAGKAFSAALFVDRLELLKNDVRAISKQIRQGLARWKPALNAFVITFSDRFPAAETY